MLNWLKLKNWGIVKVYRDIENFNDWRKTINKEESNLKSKFNIWKLQRTKLYDIYTIVTLDDADLQLPEVVQRTKVLESLNPLHRYLDEDLGFAECLNCEFNQFQDDQGKLTLSYLIVYRFNFNKLSLMWLVKSLIILGVITYVILKFDLLSKLYTWVSTLI